MALIDLKTPVGEKPGMIGAVIGFHIIMAAMVFAIIVVLITLMINTLNQPEDLKGWASIDYDAAKGARDSLVNYMAKQNPQLDVKTVRMSDFSVATASFGGVFTEAIGTMNPWIGSVSGDAARRQVEAGARALTLDIWPDPADRQSPIVVSMVDTQAWPIQTTWMQWGLTKGMGRYSNWQRLTRNTKPVGEILKPALAAAFSSSPGPQNTDPFFLILKLHGAMTKGYLNHLGDIVRNAIGANRMATEWNRCLNQRALCTEPVTSFLSKAFVIVVPDIQPGYNSLPSINTYPAFVAAFLETNLGEITNAMEMQPNTMMFDPAGVSGIASAAEAACAGASLGPSPPPSTRPPKCFCIVQPSTGGQTTDNSVLFSQSSYTTCMQSGAQFVAVNLFSPNPNDGPLTTFFSSEYFGKYSFRKV